MSETSVTAAGLSKHFGDFRAVHDLSFELPRGGVTGFVGPNGSGKSTTIRMLLGLIRATAGTATVLGHPIDKPARYIHRVGALVEAPTLYPKLSGRKNLEVLAQLGSLPNTRIDEVLDVVDLAARAGDKFEAYSLGMKQRLGIAAALLQDPDLLILDEPTNGLDPAGTVDMRHLLRRLGAQGTTVMVSSHLLSEIEAACDRLVIIQEGQLVFAGELDELLAQHRPRLIAQPADPARLADLQQLIAAAAHGVEVVGAHVEVDAGADWASQLFTMAADSGIPLIELRTHHVDLEEAFLEMTATTKGAGAR